MKILSDLLKGLVAAVAVFAIVLVPATIAATIEWAMQNRPLLGFGVIAGWIWLIATVVFLVKDE